MRRPSPVVYALRKEALYPLKNAREECSSAHSYLEYVKFRTRWVSRFHDVAYNR